jgi:hypothetical protein
MAHSDLFSLRFHYVLLTLAAAWAIVKPSLRAFLVLISLQLADVVYTMPATSNHWLFTSFVNVTIIQALLYNVIKNKSFHVTEDRLLGTFMPVVRIELLVLYFYAVFHKLNAGFSRLPPVVQPFCWRRSTWRQLSLPHRVFQRQIFISRYSLSPPFPFSCASARPPLGDIDWSDFPLHSWIQFLQCLF